MAHVTIESYLESEARAGGMAHPVIKREGDRLHLYAAADELGDSLQLVESFSTNLDAVSRIGNVVAAYMREATWSRS